MPGFLDTYLAIKSGIQPVLVVNQGSNGESNESQQRNLWLDQVDSLQNNVLDEINEILEIVANAQEAIGATFDLTFLSDEIREITKNADDFLKTLRSHCINSKSKVIDSYFALEMPKLTTVIQNTSLRVSGLTDLAFSYNELLRRFYIHFSTTGYERLEKYYECRQSVELSDLELKMKPEKFQEFVSEVEVNVDKPLEDLVQIFNAHTDSYTSLVSVVIDIWNETLEKGVVSDSTLARLEPSLEVLLPAEAKSKELIEHLDRAFARFEKRVATIS